MTKVILRIKEYNRVLCVKMISMFSQNNNNNPKNNSSSNNNNKPSPTTVPSSPPSHFTSSGTPHGIQDILARPTQQHQGSTSPSRDKSSHPSPPPASSSAMNSPSSVSTASSSGTPLPPSSLSSALGSLPRFSFPSTAQSMAYFNPAAAAAAAASTGLHKLAAGLAASDLSVARAQQFYSWPQMVQNQMVQNQACIWRDRLANSGMTFFPLHSISQVFIDG